MAIVLFLSFYLQDFECPMGEKCCKNSKNAPSKNKVERLSQGYDDKIWRQHDVPNNQKKVAFNKFKHKI